MSFLVSQMFPGTLTLIPLYIIIVQWLGLGSTLTGLVIVYVGIALSLIGDGLADRQPVAQLDVHVLDLAAGRVPSARLEGEAGGEAGGELLAHLLLAEDRWQAGEHHPLPRSFDRRRLHGPELHG